MIWGKNEGREHPRNKDEGQFVDLVQFSLSWEAQ